MIRDTRLGRWVRKHDRTHKLIHATWCRVLGPFDTKRVASSGGTMTGGGTSLVDYELTIGATLYRFPTLALAQSYANANQPDNIYTVFAVYSDGSSKVAYSGPKTSPPLPVVPAGSFQVIYAPFDVAAGLKYTGSTASDATAWAMANCPVGITYTIYQQGDGLVYTGLGSQTDPNAGGPAPPPPPKTISGYQASGYGPNATGHMTTVYYPVESLSDANADAQQLRQDGFTNVVVTTLYE
jgi:hypothetical protein